MTTHHTNTWAPDTCGCKFEFTWEDQTPDIHTPTKVLTQCIDHTGLSGTKNIFDTIELENKRKNLTVNRFVDPVRYPSLAEIITKEGTDTKQLKTGIEIKWSFTGSDDTRVLNLDLSNVPLSKAEKTEVLAWADSQFSSGKVVII